MNESSSLAHSITHPPVFPIAVSASAKLPVPTGNTHAGRPCLMPGSRGQQRILIVDDDNNLRQLCRMAVECDCCQCIEAEGGLAAISLAREHPFDLVLLDVEMPDMHGNEVLRHLRRNPLTPHMKVVMFSGNVGAEYLSQLLLDGADSYLTKPFTLVQLRAHVQAMLHWKEAQDRTDALTQSLERTNAALEQALTMRDGELIQARNGLVMALAKMVEQRSNETGPHLFRVQRCSAILAEAAAATPAFTGLISTPFVRLLEFCAPLHDIGKVGLPDSILQKPGILEPEERLRMQTHTVIGAETLQTVAKDYAFASGFFQMAIDIARHHHERFDGRGYPDRLTGTDIPLSARIVAIADVYDALRSPRSYKPSFAHATAVQMILEGSPGHFDPALVEVFAACHTAFDEVFSAVQ